MFEELKFMVVDSQVEVRACLDPMYHELIYANNLIYAVPSLSRQIHVAKTELETGMVRKI